MAAVYLKILSTRRTAVGTLYMGTVRKLDSKVTKHAAVIENMVKTKAAVKLTAKQAEAEVAQAEDVEKDNGQTDATSQLMKSKAEVDGQLANAKKTITELTDGLKRAKDQIDALQAALAKEQAETDKLRQDLASVTARAEAAEKTAKASSKG